MPEFSDPLTKSGFSAQEIYDALDYCDNDRIKALKYLQKNKKGSGKADWRGTLYQKLEAGEVAGGDLVDALWKLWEHGEYQDNVPLKPKPFKNFVANSFNLKRNMALVEQMWEVVSVQCMPSKTAAAAPAAVEEAATAEKESEGTKENKKKREESGEEPAPKKAKTNGKPVKWKKLTTAALSEHGSMKRSKLWKKVSVGAPDGADESDWWAAISESSKYDVRGSKVKLVSEE
eukprot:TRINITY_DN23767_c0_g1_i2.p1 TRINITY_DN23767_c0_g1~~TRINITY_DN23767_c0_g1_i2.p1  ORF type:complete len:232 (+),score=59.72 TRINITY_DN23767_c0_g1_i2:258-953(+)